MHPALTPLIRAKQESDRRNYRSKHLILAELLRKFPKDFLVDSEEKGIVGLTHKPTKFKIHIPYAKAPAEIAMITKNSWLEVNAGLRGNFQKFARLWQQARDDQRESGFLEYPTGKIVTRLPDDYDRGFYVPFLKAAEAMKPITSALNLSDNALNQMIGGPTPLLATLTGGLLSAGLGYGTGSLISALAGDNIDGKRLKRNLALFGGALGTLPGLYLGVHGMNRNQEEGKNRWSAWVEPNRLFGQIKTSSEYSEILEEPLDLPDVQIDTTYLEKLAFTGGLSQPSIPVDAFNRAVWRDPYTPLPVRATLSGMLSGASELTDRNFVSPLDVGRIAVGMGTGSVSGMVLGKVLGSLAGLRPEAQKTLQQAGLWAGAIRGAAPMLFGR